MNHLESLVKKLIKENINSQTILLAIKRDFAKTHKLNCPKNSWLLSTYHRMIEQGKGKKNECLENLLRIRKVRSFSGIVSVSVLTKPYPCPGKCLYCPTQRNLPKSYLEGEPAVMRAMANNFNPYRQTKARLKALKATGHSASKIELIVIGGTWSFLPSQYQNWFIKECFRACNQGKSKNLLQAQKANEKAKQRIIGITIETRPDFINQKEIKKLRKLGVTRVELGVQALDDRILKKNYRGHGIAQTVKATRLLKDAGFKICYHLMPNLPGSTLKKDEKMFIDVFKNPDFCPDFLKIYPCVVVKQAPLYKLWLEGKFRPYRDRQLINLLVKAKQQVPAWCRIIRIYRDIPSPQIMAGSKVSNLRQVLAKELKKQGKECRCIRCREIRGDFSPKQKLKLFRENYSASGGKEVFLTYEDEKRKKLFAILRLRLSTTKEILFPELKNAALIRDLHTYGQAISFGQKTKNSPQHRCLGKKLIKKAEKIAKDKGFKKIAIIAGVGSRDYYRRLGYKLKNSYMIKKI